jgi:hypothetical protein
MNETLKDLISKLAVDYRDEEMTLDEIQDVLMGYEYYYKVDYEVIYKQFNKECKKIKVEVL